MDDMINADDQLSHFDNAIPTVESPTPNVTHASSSQLTGLRFLIRASLIFRISLTGTIVFPSRKMVSVFIKLIVPE